MIFPNHPAYAEIRAGMGYQPGGIVFASWILGGKKGRR
jgi:hypothetical protein